MHLSGQKNKSRSATVFFIVTILGLIVAGLSLLCMLHITARNKLSCVRPCLSAIYK